MATFSIDHQTHYRYSEPVRRSAQVLRLTPASGHHQQVIRWQLSVPGQLRPFVDAFGNLSHLLTVDANHSAIEIKAFGIVDVLEHGDGEVLGPIPAAVFQRPTSLTECSAEMLNFLDPMRATILSRPLAGLSDLATALLDHMPYSPGVTTVAFSAAQAFAAGRGVCQDHTHVFIACCRAIGLAARYVSGYVQGADSPQSGTPRITSAASHAWAEVWVGNRWVSFDISNAHAVGAGHVRLAVGLDYADACPIRGVRLGGGEESMSASAAVRLTQLTKEQTERSVQQ